MPTKSRRKGSKAKPAGLSQTAANTTVTHSVEDLLNQGNIALSNMQVELAEQFYSRALTAAPDDTNIMDVLADVNLQLGEIEKAKQLLLSSTQRAPSQNPYKWLFLAQLQTGSDAVESYRTAISALSAQTEETDESTRNVTLKQIVKAHCSIAEVYMTDLCFEPSAEAMCEKEVSAALALDPNSLDGNQTLVSLRLSQNRKGDAAKIIKEVYSKLNHIRSVVASRTIVDEISGANEPREFQELPEMEFCIATVKLLIECGGAEDPELYQNAMDLANSLLQDDDENIEVWYLIGVAALSSNPPDIETAHHHLQQAKAMMDQIREEIERQRLETSEPPIEFLYQEQYDLVIDHLKMIENGDCTGYGAGGESRTAGNSNCFAADSVTMDKFGPTTTVETPIAADEEWSDDEPEETSSMAVDA